MKKTFIILIISFLVILSMLLAFLFAFQNEGKLISKANSEYECYLNKRLYGTELVTIINKAIDYNNKNNIQKNENGFFISNDKDSILIYIQMLGKDEKFQMERFLAVGTEDFIKLFNSSIFISQEYTYHKETGKIATITFKQVEE